MPRYSYHTIAHEQLAPERYKWMGQQADAAGIALNFFPWVTPADIPHTPHHYDERQSRRNNGRGVLPTELACTLAHVQLMRKLLDSRDDWFVIFEDDMELPHNLDTIVREAINVGRGRLIKLSGLNSQPFDVITKLSTGQDYIRFRRTPTSAGGYIISRAGAELLVPYCSNVLIVIDELFRRTFEHRVASYGVWPYPVIHSPRFQSTVGDRSRRYDHNNPLLKGLSRFNRLVEGVKKRLLPPLD